MRGYPGLEQGAQNAGKHHRSAAMSLAARFLSADESDFNAVAALGTGDIESYRLGHDSFRHGGDDGIDAVKAMVQHFKLAHNTGEVRYGLITLRFELVFFCQENSPFPVLSSL